jgi:invasion protein IalB
LARFNHLKNLVNQSAWHEFTSTGTNAQLREGKPFFWTLDCGKEDGEEEVYAISTNQINPSDPEEALWVLVDGKKGRRNKGTGA